MSVPDADLPGASGPRSAHEAIAAAASEWVARHDRGLSGAEQDHYLSWLAADPRHAEAIARERRTWEAFDRLAGLQTSLQAIPDPDLLAPSSPVARGWLLRFPRWTVLAAAALAVLAYTLSPRGRPDAAPRADPMTRLVPIADQSLADGSLVRLNRGAQMEVSFSATERRVRLLKGEAVFEVAKDSHRPFLVESGGVTVHAVGTVFNVRLAERAVDVIVTEGRVAVAHATTALDAAPKLDAGQRILMSRAPTAEPAVVTTPSREELARRLAWQPRILTFTEEPLPAILNEFNLHNPVALRLDDPRLEEFRLSARIRSDNVPGFLRLLESEFKIVAEVQPSGEIALRAPR